MSHPHKQDPHHLSQRHHGKTNISEIAEGFRTPQTKEQAALSAEFLKNVYPGFSNLSINSGLMILLCAIL